MRVVEAIRFPEHHNLVVAFILVLMTSLVLRSPSDSALISHLTRALGHISLSVILLGRGHFPL